MKNLYKPLIQIVCISILSLILFSCDKRNSEIVCPACTLAPMVGPCNAAFPKYYFDQEEKKCKQFIWGGCEGVVPFETMEECEACDCQ